MEHDGGDDALTPDAVGGADDGHVLDARVAAEHVLDLAGGDLEAPALDEVHGLAAGDRHVTVAVPTGDIAGDEPAVAEGGGRLLGTAPVAGHHAVAAGQDLAGLVRRDVMPSLVHDPDLAAGDRQTHRAGTPVLVRVRQREKGLAHAVALQDAVAGQLLESMEVVGGKRGAAGSEEAAARKRRS